jgi:hypothetical protein
MSYRCHHVDIYTGGPGAQASSSSPARWPSTHRVYLKRKDLDDSVVEESNLQPTLTAVDDTESDASSNLTGRTRKKAEPVKSTCMQCQKRKTKCSGRRQVCSFCSNRILECSWDVGEGLTRTADLKRKLLEANRLSLASSWKPCAWVPTRLLLCSLQNYARAIHLKAACQTFAHSSQHSRVKGRVAITRESQYMLPI